MTLTKHSVVHQPRWWWKGAVEDVDMVRQKAEASVAAQTLQSTVFSHSFGSDALNKQLGAGGNNRRFKNKKNVGGKCWTPLLFIHLFS